MVLKAWRCGKSIKVGQGLGSNSVWSSHGGDLWSSFMKNKTGFKLHIKGHQTYLSFFVGPSKEDIFSGHLLSPLFQSSLHITIDVRRPLFLKAPPLVS